MIRMGRVKVPPGRLAADALHEYALRALARRSHTVHEIEAKIRRRSASEADVAAVLQRLGSLGLLDDERVAETHSAVRREVGVVAPRRVLDELKRRGVQETTARDAVEDAFQGHEESELAIAHLRRKLGAQLGEGSVEDPRELARLYRALARAGFRPSAIAEALRSVAADSEWADALAEAGDADEYGG